MTRLCAFSAFFAFLLFAPCYAPRAQAEEGGRPSSREMRRDMPRLDEVFPKLRGRSLVCNIDAVVLEDGGEVAWQASDSKITIPGRPVSLKLAGENLVLALSFTPYIRGGPGGAQNGVLVVQGQIWLNDEAGGIHYQSIMQSIPMSLGEKIYFYPLGRRSQNERSIEIHLNLAAYEEE